ncbi:DUF6708 domain-containing protein [Luteimonas sp. A537]
MPYDQDDGVLVPEWKQPEPELEFTAEQRRKNIYAKKGPLRVMPKDKRQPVHTAPLAHNAILRVRPEAVEVGTIQGAGVANYLGISGIMLFCVLLIPLYMAFLFSFSENGSYFFLAFFVPVLLLIMVSVVFIRRGFFSPADHPVLFNRKTREVHVIPIQRLSFLRFWEKGAPGALRSYRWEDVQARTYRRLDVPGGTVARTETVMQMLCTTQEQPTQVDLMVDLGVTGTWRDATQVQLWEHIRRYMEEEGPPLNPGDTLRKTNYDKLPDFPPHVVAAAGGPALSEVELVKWTVKQA